MQYIAKSLAFQIVETMALWPLMGNHFPLMGNETDFPLIGNHIPVHPLPMLSLGRV